MLESDKQVPDKIILNIADAVVFFMRYISNGFDKRYLSATELINGILSFICTEDPYDGLRSFLRVVEAQLTDEEFSIADIVEIMYRIEVIGNVIILEFDRLGFYKLSEFWGYKLILWISPTAFVLSSSMPYELEKILNIYSEPPSYL